MTCVSIKEKVGPSTSIINHLSVPNNTIKSESLVFPKKIGQARFKYIINIKDSKKHKQKIGHFK
jgi:hypothetical protein